MTVRNCISVALLTLAGVLIASFTLAAAPTPPPLPKTVEFNRDIRPILSDNCYACHGPDKNKRKADLRLDTKGGLFDEIDDVHPIVPGKPEESDLYRRITSTDADDQMPPRKSAKRLTPEQIGRIKRWIEQGAVWKGH